MPMLQYEAQIPFGRRVFRSILKLANAAILIIGIFTNMLSLEINPSVDFCPGVLLLMLGFATMLGAVTGFGSYESPFYFKSHVITMSLAIFGNAIFCLVIFAQRSKVAASFASSRFSVDDMDQYLSSISWVYAFVVSFEVCFKVLIPSSVALFARVLFQRLVAHEQFETLSQREDTRSVALGIVRPDIEDHSGRVDQTRAETLERQVVGMWQTKRRNDADP